MFKTGNNTSRGFVCCIRSNKLTTLHHLKVRVMLDTSDYISRA